MPITEEEVELWFSEVHSKLDPGESEPVIAVRKCNSGETVFMMTPQVALGFAERMKKAAEKLLEEK